MSNIEERIVKMSFDNRDFEGRITQTIQSLEKLNDILKNTSNVEVYSNLSKSLKDVKSHLSTLNLDELNKATQTESIWTKLGNAFSSAGKGIAGFIGKLNIGDKLGNLASSFGKATEGSNGLSKSVETVTNKFSALGIMGATALANITNKAVNAGTALLKSFTIDPIKDGFGEYELKMESIKTILANTKKDGTTLDDVNKALNELNQYSDETIYNFAQMTDNIGKATAAGVGLEDSVAFVKGMSNAAAVFGVDATRMAGATYQMTQALASGVVQLQDWRSLEQAGMGGKLMQDEMIKTAKAMGKNVDTTKAFRDTLKDGWLTADVFIATMKRMANDPSMKKAATEVTSFSKLMDTLKEQVGSGWATSFEHIFGNKDQSTKLWTNLSESLGDIILKSADARNKVLEFWNANGGRDAMISGLGNVFTSLGKVLGSVKSAFQEVFPPMTGKKLVELTNKFKTFTEKIKITDSAAKKIKDVFKGVFTIFDTVKDSVMDLLGGFTPLGSIIQNMTKGVLNVASGFGKFATNIGQSIQKAGIFETIAGGIKTALGWIDTAVSKLGDGFNLFGEGLAKMDFTKVFGVIGKAFQGLGSYLKPVADGIGTALASIDFGTIMNVLKTGTFLNVLKTLKDTFGEVADVAESAKGVFGSLKGIGKGIKETLSGVKEALEAWQQDLQAKTLMKIAAAIGILALSLMMIATIDGKSLVKSLAGLGVIFAELAAAYMAIAKVGGIKKTLGVATSLISMSVAMLILAGALKVLSTIKIGEMVTGLVGLAVVFGLMITAVKKFDGVGAKLGRTASGLVIFGVALMVMAGALKLLGSIDAETIGGGLFTLAVLLAELAGFLAAAKFGNLNLTTASAILVLSTALVVLSQAVKGFGAVPTDELIRGLVGIAAILTEIAVFSKFAGGGLDMIAIGVGLTAMSAALHVMSSAMKSLGSIQWDEIGRSLVAMAGGLLILGVATKTISGGKMILLGAGIAVMSGALMLLTAALKSMGSMSWEEIGKSLLTLAGALLVLGVAMYAMTGAIVGAAAMVIMAGAMALLTPQLILLGNMNLAGVGIMLLALAGAFTVLGLAGLVLTPIIPSLLGLAGAIALLGVGCIAAGAGLTMVGTALGLIGAAIGGSGLLILEFLRQAIKLLPEMGTKAAEAFGNFMLALAETAPKIQAGMVTLFGCLADAVLQNASKFVDTGVQLALKFAEGLSTALPQLVQYGMTMVEGVLKGIADNIGKVVDQGARIIVNFLDGIARNLDDVIESGINLALSFLEGVAEGLENNQGRIEAAVERVINALIDAALEVIRGSVSAMKTKGKEFLQGFVDGIEEKWEAAKTAVKQAVDKAKEGASNCGTKLVQAGRDMIAGFIKGIKEKALEVYNAAKSVVEKAIKAAKEALDINSPSKVFIAIGGSVNEGFAKGLHKYSDESAGAATDLANAVIDNVRNPLSNISKILGGEIDVNPVITPVLDLSNVQAQSKRLGGMFSNNPIQLNGVSGRLAGSVGTIQNGATNNDVVSALKDLQDSLNTNNNNTTYNVNGITYDDGSNVTKAVETLVRAAKIERRI